MKTQQKLAIEGPEETLKAIGAVINCMMGDPTLANELDGTTVRLVGAQVTKENLGVQREYVFDVTHDCAGGKPERSLLPEPERMLLRA